MMFGSVVEKMLGSKIVKLEFFYRLFCSVELGVLEGLECVCGFVGLGGYLLVAEEI